MFSRGIGRGNDYAMKVYMDMRAGKLDMVYLTRFENYLRRNWPAGEVPPSIQDVLK